MNHLVAVREYPFGSREAAVSPLSWVHITAPKPEEIGRLQREWGIPLSFVTHCLDRDERARMEREDGQTLIIVRVPHFQGKTADIPYSTLPFGIILTPERVVTVCMAATKTVEQLSNMHPRPTNHNQFILQLLMANASAYLSYLQHINHTVETLEDRLQASTRNKEVLELLKYQKSLVYFTTGLCSNELLMERLQKSQWFHLDEAEQELLEDVFIEHHQAVEMVTIAENILSQMMDAFASIISNNLNVVMEFLAAVTIVLALPTLVASIYGMNVQLPFQESVYAFHLLMAISAVSALVVALVFVWRRWL